MNDTTNASKFAPEGWHTITPRIVVHNAKQLIVFLGQVFDATGEYLADRPSVITIGDSMLMIGDAGVRNPSAAFSTYMSKRSTPHTGAPLMPAPTLWRRRSIRRTETVVAWWKMNGVIPGKSPRK